MSSNVSPQVVQKVTNPEEEAALLKVEANQQYKAEKYQEAVALYTQAIGFLLSLRKVKINKDGEGHRIESQGCHALFQPSSC